MPPIPEMTRSLGRLIAVHPTSPAFMQRAAIVAALSFIFFLATLIAFLLRQNFIYFLLATAFLIVQIFTLIGWWLQRRNAVHIYANGLTYKKLELPWDEIQSTFRNDDGSLVIRIQDDSIAKFPGSIHALDRVESFIRRHLAPTKAEAGPT